MIKHDELNLKCKELYPSLRKHAYFITPNRECDKPISMTEIIDYFSAFVKRTCNVKILNDCILIFEFTTPQRLRVNFVEFSYCIIERIKYSKCIDRLNDFHIIQK